MKKILIPTLIIFVTIIILVLIEKNTGVETPILPTKGDNILAPILSFNWDFEEAPTFNLDGQPQTEIYLLVTYENNISDRKLIDIVNGNCSELPGKYDGDISNTQKIQCYSAGLGQQYRITSGENSYFIERKLFEEGVPDSPPTDYDWELLEKLPLMK